MNAMAATCAHPCQACHQHHISIGKDQLSTNPPFFLSVLPTPSAPTASTNQHNGTSAHSMWISYSKWHYHCFASHHMTTQPIRPLSISPSTSNESTDGGILDMAYLIPRNQNVIVCPPSYDLLAYSSLSSNEDIRDKAFSTSRHHKSDQWLPPTSCNNQWFEIHK